MDLLFRLALTLSVATLAAAASLLMRKYFAKPQLPGRFDRSDVGVSGVGPVLVEFTSPYCIECQTALPVLEAAAETHRTAFAVIDARERPDLTRKYAIRSTPTILVVDGRGKVTSAWRATPAEGDLARALAAASN